MAKKNRPPKPSPRQPVAGTRAAPRDRRGWLVGVGLAVAVVAGLALLGAGAWYAGWPPFGTRVNVADLRPVPEVDVSRLDEADQAQLAAQRAQIDRLAAARPVDGGALAAAYGKLGEIHLAFENLPAAEAALANAHDLAPEEPRWSYFLGDLYSRQALPAQAIPHFEAVMAQEPANATAMVRLAKELRDVKRVDEAALLLEAALVQDPAAAAALNMLGELAYEAGDYPTAIRHWQAALVLQPEATILHRQLANAYRDSGDLAKAEAELALRGDGAVRLHDPRLFEVTTRRQAAGAQLLEGGKFMAAGRAAEAADLYRRAVEQEPANAIAHLGLGAALMQLGKAAEAEAEFQTVLQLEPGNVKATYNLGLLALATGKKDEGRQALDEVLKREPDNVDAHLALAQLFRNDGDCARAAPHYRQVLAQTPKAANVRQAALVCQVSLSDFAGALQLAEAGYEQDPKDVVTVDALVRLLAAAPDAAVRDGPRAVQIAEENMASSSTAEGQEVLAMAYAAVGRYADAAAIQRRVLATFQADPKQAAMLAHLGANLADYEAGRPASKPFPAFAVSP